MGRCSYCRSKIYDDEVYCPTCGIRIERKNDANKIFKLIAKITAIITVVFWGILAQGFFLVFGMVGEPLIGMAFFIPFVWSFILLLSVFRKLNSKKPISKAFKIFILIFLSVPTGVMLLLLKKEEFKKTNEEIFSFKGDEDSKN